MRSRTPVWKVVVAIAGIGALGASGASCRPADRAEQADTHTITVFAAASLTDAFNDLADRFETEYPDISVTLNFGSSAQLAAQISEGAPVDVFASADIESMTAAVASRSESTDSVSPTGPTVFAQNSLAIAVEPGNPRSITGLADLSDRDLVVVVCAPEVPCGAYAQRVIERAGIDVTPASFEANVKGVVSKVAVGEADAGIVYATDIADGEPQVSGVEIPDADNIVADYPIALIDPTSTAAKPFVDFVLGPVGQDILAAHGFLGAPGP